MGKKANELWPIRQIWWMTCCVFLFSSVSACEKNTGNEEEISPVNNEQQLNPGKNGRNGQKGSGGQDGQSGEDGKNSVWGKGGDGGNGGDAD